MSTLTLHASSAKTVIPKNLPEVKIPTFKGDLSYEDALKAMATYDSIIKEAAKRRQPDAESYVNALEWHHVIKGVYLSAATIAIEIGLAATGTIDLGVEGVEGLGEGLAYLYTLVGFIGVGVASSSSEKLLHFFSPIKAKKLKAEQEAEKALVELKENEFKEVESKVLKKIKKSLKVIEAHLKYESRTVVYSNTKGEEGFSIQEIAPLNSWEAELLRLEKEKMSSELKQIEP